ncbi:hypothetical protein P9112_009885 [Eukaryota sp. TZLM1-RC]
MEDSSKKVMILKFEHNKKSNKTRSTPSNNESCCVNHLRVFSFSMKFCCCCVSFIIFRNPSSFYNTWWSIFYLVQEPFPLHLNWTHFSDFVIFLQRFINTYTLK